MLGFAIPVADIDVDAEAGTVPDTAEEVIAALASELGLDDFDGIEGMVDIDDTSATDVVRIDGIPVAPAFSPLTGDDASSPDDKSAGDSDIASDSASDGPPPPPPVPVPGAPVPGVPLPAADSWDETIFSCDPQSLTAKWCSSTRKLLVHRAESDTWEQVGSARLLTGRERFSCAFMCQLHDKCKGFFPAYGRALRRFDQELLRWTRIGAAYRLDIGKDVAAAHHMSKRHGVMKLVIVEVCGIRYTVCLTLPRKLTCSGKCWNASGVGTIF